MNTYASILRMFCVKDRVLHVVYDAKLGLPADIEKIASFYEGHVSGRVGFNFPMKVVNEYKSHTCVSSYTEKADYVIVYKKGDIITKKHELQHAKFFMDSSFREEVALLWKRFSTRFQERATNMLKKMNYPDHVLLDEFQAYYFTESSNFFGKD
jgi:hypothetical protein